MNTNYQFYPKAGIPEVSGIKKEVMIRTSTMKALVSIDLWICNGSKTVSVSVTRLKEDYSVSTVFLDFKGNKATKDGWKAFSDLVKMLND